MIKRIDDYIGKNKIVYLFFMFLDVNMYIVCICTLLKLLIDKSNGAIFCFFIFCLIDTFLFNDFISNLRNYKKI